MLSAIAAKGVPLAAAIAAESTYVTSPENNKRLFGLVIISNVVISGFTLVNLGMKVSEARKKYNVPYPTMYATADTDDAKRFNCVQRGHQQALETYPMFLALSLISGLRFPIITALNGLLYAVARSRWAEHYSELGAEHRYGSWLAKQVWTPLIALSLSSLYFAGELLSGLPIPVVMMK